MNDLNSNAASPVQRLTPRPRWGVRLVLVLLVVVFATVAVALLAPGVALQILSFAPRGNVESFWDEVEQAETPVGRADIVPNRLPQALIALEQTAIPTLAPTQTAIPTVTPAPIMPTFTTSPTAPDATPPPPVVPPTVSPSPTSVPNPYASLFTQASIPSGVVLITENLLTLGLTADDTFASALWFGQSISQEPLGIVEFQESAIPDLCGRVFNDCRTERYRIDKVDFRPGGLMVYGSINLGLFWQSMGIALLLDEDRRSLIAGGVILGEVVYQVPTSGAVANILTDLTARGNAALATLRVQGGGYDLGLKELFFDHDRFIAVLG